MMVIENNIAYLHACLIKQLKVALKLQILLCKFSLGVNDLSMISI
jgi:hypothetical protein